MGALELVCRVFARHTGRRGRRRVRPARPVHPVTPPPVTDPAPTSTTHPYPQEQK